MTMSKKKLSGLSDEMEFRNDMPRLEKGFNITPGPFNIPLGIPEDANNFDDDVTMVLS